MDAFDFSIVLCVPGSLVQAASASTMGLIQSTGEPNIRLLGAYNTLLLISILFYLLPR